MCRDARMTRRCVRWHAWRTLWIALPMDWHAHRLSPRLLPGAAGLLYRMPLQVAALWVPRRMPTATRGATHEANHPSSLESARSIQSTQLLCALSSRRRCPPSFLSKPSSRFALHRRPAFAAHASLTTLQHTYTCRTYRLRHLAFPCTGTPLHCHISPRGHVCVCV